MSLVKIRKMQVLFKICDYLLINTGDLARKYVDTLEESEVITSLLIRIAEENGTLSDTVMLDINWETGIPLSVLESVNEELK